MFWCWELLGRPLPLPPAPPLTALELNKIVVPHYSSIAKAQRDFGWTPQVSPEDAVLRCLPYMIKLHSNVERVDRPHWRWWVSIPLGMGLLALLAFSPDAHTAWSAQVTSRGHRAGCSRGSSSGPRSSTSTRR